MQDIVGSSGCLKMGQRLKITLVVAGLLFLRGPVPAIATAAQGLEESTEADALIAYLQQLGTLIKDRR